HRAAAVRARRVGRPARLDPGEQHPPHAVRRVPPVQGVSVRRRYARDERGQMLPMIIGFGIIVILLCAVVFDASQAFVYRRGLHAIADGAALAATNGIDKSAIYEGGLGDKVILSRELAQQEVDRYLAAGNYQSL